MGKLACSGNIFSVKQDLKRDFREGYHVEQLFIHVIGVIIIANTRCLKAFAKSVFYFKYVFIFPMLLQMHIFVLECQLPRLGSPLS